MDSDDEILFEFASSYRDLYALKKPDGVQGPLLKKIAKKNRIGENPKDQVCEPLNIAKFERAIEKFFSDNARVATV